MPEEGLHAVPPIAGPGIIKRTRIMVGIDSKAFAISGAFACRCEDNSLRTAKSFVSSMLQSFGGRKQDQSLADASVDDVNGLRQCLLLLSQGNRALLGTQCRRQCYISAHLPWRACREIPEQTSQSYCHNPEGKSYVHGPGVEASTMLQSTNHRERVRNLLITPSSHTATIRMQ